MGFSKFMPWALFAALCFTPMQASASPAYACSVAEIFECTAIAGCARVSAAQANLPPLVTLNVKEKKLFSGLFGGDGLFDQGDVYEDPKVLILHGRHGLLTWTAVVAKDTGQMSMSIANLGKTYANSERAPRSNSSRRQRWKRAGPVPGSLIASQIVRLLSLTLIETDRGPAHDVPGLGREVLLQRAFRDDALPPVGEYGNGNDLAAVGILFSQVHIGAMTFVVILRMHEPERHWGPHAKSPGRGDTRPRPAILRQDKKTSCVR
ncbi:MAG TPA: hypothetical protein VHK26_10785 [Methyloceanibacter sp.]|nr:hypothetical protein [Methyloceanibacter sp.]